MPSLSGGSSSGGASDTELPAAAALADNTANPTAPAVGAHILVWDGATWDRATGEPTNGLDVDVTRMAALVTGTAAIGQVGMEPRTSGGLTISRLISAATTNATVVKASAGQLFGWYIFNVNSSVRYLKIYNKATSPTVGTDTPILTIAIPAANGANVEFTNGIACSAGIGFALTTGVADADTAAVAANEITVNLLYK